MAKEITSHNNSRVETEFNIDKDLPRQINEGKLHVCEKHFRPEDIEMFFMLFAKHLNLIRCFGLNMYILIMLGIISCLWGLIIH